MIEIKSICKSFDGRDVLKEVSSVFKKGECNLIIGRSGSGKTVLMNCIVGLMVPDGGQVLYDGEDVVKMTKREKILLRRRMGMLFQGSALFDSMTFLDNVMFPLNMFSNESYKGRKRIALQCLDRVNLSDAGNKLPEELSGGMQKRAAIARAISMNPQYLFCDEPNSGLDPKTSLVIDKLVYSITKENKITTIVNTHDMNSVMGIGDNILFLSDGLKEWQGSNTEIMTSENEKINDFIFASDFSKQLKRANEEQKQA